ncbi:MAG: 4-hydroxy-tetrahydrodipicolinate reductase [Clostridia bacterium]|nr:4-hydroxy-tetrahydrodipicolinate reductase [Clostridia bacterium]MCI9247322.1 4-hydroxy-tetrahydrodipicolinate reductase [Clostridia bacterium]
MDKRLTVFGDVPVYDDISKIKEIPDVIVDFSHVHATLEILKFADDKHIPIVIATTGFNREQEKILEDYSKRLPVFRSANMSFDINLMCKLVAQIAPLFADSDIEITETHHRNKVDAPSGTALLLANSINDALGGKMKYVYNRHDLSQKREANEIGFTSIRGGNIVGEHVVQFFGPNDTFEIKHTSYSRTVFAEGAVKALKFIADKPNGLYTMNDLV